MLSKACPDDGHRLVCRARRTYLSSTEPPQSKARETVQDTRVIPNSKRDYEGHRQQVIMVEAKSTTLLAMFQCFLLRVKS